MKKWRGGGSLLFIINFCDVFLISHPSPSSFSGDPEHCAPFASHLWTGRPYCPLRRVGELSPKHGWKIGHPIILMFLLVFLRLSKANYKSIIATSPCIKCLGKTGSVHLRHEVVNLGRQRHHKWAELAPDPPKCCQVRFSLVWWQSASELALNCQVF